MWAAPGRPPLFFSRRIGLQRGAVVPILAGGRLTGKIGAFDVGALNIQTDDERLSGAQTTNFTVLRVKRDILPSEHYRRHLHQPLGVAARRRVQPGLWARRPARVLRRRDTARLCRPHPDARQGPAGMPATSGSSTMPVTAMVWTSRMFVIEDNLQSRDRFRAPGQHPSNHGVRAVQPGTQLDRLGPPVQPVGWCGLHPVCRRPCARDSDTGCRARDPAREQ